VEVVCVVRVDDDDDGVVAMVLGSVLSVVDD